MLTRRYALTLLGAIPFAALTRTTAFASTADCGAMSTEPTADRELSLRLSDHLRQQHWNYAGQRYTEVRDAIVLNEGEWLRLNVTNDTANERTVLLDDLSLTLAPHQTQSLDLHIETLASKTLRTADQSVLRHIAIRPAYQQHPLLPA